MPPERLVHAEGFFLSTSSTGGAFGVTNPRVTPTNMVLWRAEGDDRRPGDSSEGPREVWKVEDRGRLRTVPARWLWRTLPLLEGVTMAMATVPPASWQRYSSGGGGFFAPITFSLQSLIFAVAPEMKLRWELRGRLAPALFTVSSIIQIPNTPPPPPPPPPLNRFWFLLHPSVSSLQR